jgi:hypothetical protein
MRTLGFPIIRSQAEGAASHPGEGSLEERVVAQDGSDLDRESGKYIEEYNEFAGWTAGELCLI